MTFELFHGRIQFEDRFHVPHRIYLRSTPEGEKPAGSFNVEALIKNVDGLSPAYAITHGSVLAVGTYQDIGDDNVFLDLAYICHSNGSSFHEQEPSVELKRLHYNAVPVTRPRRAVMNRMTSTTVHASLVTPLYEELRRRAHVESFTEWVNMPPPVNSLPFCSDVTARKDYAVMRGEEKVFDFPALATRLATVDLVDFRHAGV